MKGKILIDREIFESDLWEKPAYYLKVWLWIIGRANWKTIQKGGKTFNRGEFKTDYKEIIEGEKWKIGWRTKKLTKDKVFSVLDFLRKTQRIHTTKTTRGLWIKVLNYDYFQRFLDYESNYEANNEGNKKATDYQQGKRNTNAMQIKERENALPSKKELINSYKEGSKTYKPFYMGNEMRYSQKKLWVIEDGQWLEFNDLEEKIDWK